jgi:hypothetical protein
MLIWQDTNNVRLDETIMFSKGYDTFGLDYLRLEAVGAQGNYLMWPERINKHGGPWSLYRDSDGLSGFALWETEEECKAEAEKWERFPPVN